MSNPTEVPLTNSLLNSDESRGAVEELHCMTPLHFLDFDMFSVMIRKTQLRSYTV